MFPTQETLNRHVTWTDPVIQFVGMKPVPMRVIGVAADIDDEHLVPRPTLTVYTPFGQGPPQPVERAGTLEDVRGEVLTPDRLNALVFGGFAVVALVIAVVGVGGVLAFSVSARTREFGIRLAIGSQPRHLLGSVIAEGTILTAAGIGAGLAGAPRCNGRRAGGSSP